MADDVMVVTTNDISGYSVKKVLGLVSGLTARSRGVGGRFVAGLQTLVGGEISAFTSEVEKARIEALDRLKENARKMGANAVLRTDMETTEIYISTVLFSATGTAVVVEREK